MEMNIPTTVYVHSWELTPEFIPKIQLPFKENFVTFHNIKNICSRLEKILQQHNFSLFHNYLKN